MKVQGKSNKFGFVIRVNDKWVKVSEQVFNSIEKGDEVDDKFNKTESTPTAKVFYPESSIKDGTKKAEFRSPNQIMASTAIGVALSFVATSLQNDVEKTYEEKKKLAFDLAKEVEVYING